MLLKQFLSWFKRNPCAECLYYQPQNNTCGSKKAVTMGPGYVTRMDRLFCEPNKEGMMESDYISRWKAQDAMTAENLIYNLDQVENGDAHRYARAAIRVLERLEPADVRPVKQGEWMMMVDSMFNGERFVEWTCSECGYVRNRGWRHTNDGKDPNAKFCENCGAKMGRR